MKILAISGSARVASTNTAMLQAVSHIARPDHLVTVFSEISCLPVFSPDFEGGPLPSTVRRFTDMIEDNDGIIVASPEYVRAIPGGLKNAIDWLVSRDEMIAKPIALMHASHRGEDMLAQLRLVLSTVSQRFSDDLFIRFELMKLSPEEIAKLFIVSKNQATVKDFLSRFEQYCEQ